MRMKFNNPIQLLAVSAVEPAGSLFADRMRHTYCGLRLCELSAMAAGPNNYGEIDVFEINSESGRMRQIHTSPFPSGGRNPVAEAVSPDHANLYVVNEDDNTIVQFIIGSDGKLYGQNTVNTPGIFPLAVTVSSMHLFVVDTYQPLPTCSPASPCSGSDRRVSHPDCRTGWRPQSIPARQHAGNPSVNTSISASYWPLLLSGKAPLMSSFPPRSPPLHRAPCLRDRLRFRN